MVQAGTYWHVLILTIQSGYAALLLDSLLQYCPADSMDRSQLGKTTASVSSYYIIIEALGGPSAGPRFKEISIWFESRITIDIIMRNAQWA